MIVKKDTNPDKPKGKNKASPKPKPSGNKKLDEAMKSLLKMDKNRSR